MPAGFRSFRDPPTLAARRRAVKHEADYDLVQRVLRKEPAAIDEFEARMVCVIYFSKSLVRKKRVSLRPDDFEDLQQNVRLEIVKSLPKYRGESRLETWAYTICEHCVSRLIRKRDRDDHGGNAALPDDIPAPPAPDDPEEELEAFIRPCTEREREILRLRFRDGLSCEEIALRLGISENTVRTLLQRALRKLGKPPPEDRPRKGEDDE